MTAHPSDVLLRAGQLLTLLFMAIFLLSSLLIVVGLGTVLLWWTGFLGVPPESATGLDPAVAPQMSLAMVLAFVATLMAFRFTQLLSRIIKSVGDGDPFTLVNSKRLRSMAILAVAYQLVSLALFYLGATVVRIEPIESLVSGEDVSLTALLLALVLFILARVFRHGAAMREDLDGTV